MWIDSHNHLHDPRLGDATPLIAAMRRVDIRHCIVNATREDDWAAVEKLTASQPTFALPAFGIHPWHAHTASCEWRQNLRHLLERHPRASIGECGLDQWISHPAIDVQRPIFIAHLQLARELDRPLTIHCLKAWGALFEALSESPPPSRFLMHSFNGSIETARRLIPLGAFSRFPATFYKPANPPCSTSSASSHQTGFFLKPTPQTCCHPQISSLTHFQKNKTTRQTSPPSAKHSPPPSKSPRSASQTKLRTTQHAVLAFKKRVTLACRSPRPPTRKLHPIFHAPTAQHHPNLGHRPRLGLFQAQHSGF